MLGRRTLLGAATLAGWAGTARAQRTASYSLLVAGPEGGRLEVWAERLAPALAQSLAPGQNLRVHTAGGTDGVTGANQFEARITPDGATAMLVPGDAALAWLVGDPRAQFDVTRWLPLMGAMAPGVLATRLPPGGLALGGRVRVAAAGPVGRDLPGLLGLELLGLSPEVVFGLQDPAVLDQSLAGNAADAVFLCGETAPQRLAQMQARGFTPLFACGTSDSEGTLQRDPRLPHVPTLTQAGLQLNSPVPDSALFAAWRAAAAAAQTDFALVLQQATPASAAAAWRQAAALAGQAPAVRSAGTAYAPMIGPHVVTALQAMAADTAALDSLRRWLDLRLNWRPT